MQTLNNPQARTEDTKHWPEMTPAEAMRHWSQMTPAARWSLCSGVEYPFKKKFLTRLKQCFMETWETFEAFQAGELTAVKAHDRLFRLASGACFFGEQERYYGRLGSKEFKQFCLEAYRLCGCPVPSPEEMEAVKAKPVYRVGVPAELAKRWERLDEGPFTFLYPYSFMPHWDRVWLLNQVKQLRRDAKTAYPDMDMDLAGRYVHTEDGCTGTAWVVVDGIVNGKVICLALTYSLEAFGRAMALMRYECVKSQRPSKVIGYYDLVLADIKKQRAQQRAL